MKYECGHKGCDICGQRHCERGFFQLTRFGQLEVCDSCVHRAVDFTHSVACRFGGTIINLQKPCAKPLRQQPQV